MPSKATTEAGDMLDLLISKASALRAAGYTEVSIGDMTAKLSPPEPEPVAAEKHDQHPPSPIDPLSDPATYGGGRVPGFPRPKE